MQSKTSCFNKTVFRKNMTRFAPVWVVYTLCLVVGLFLLYTNSSYGQGVYREYWFVNDMTEMVNIMGVINVGYALLTAQLLFGDLYNSRMCNMLHALPVRRESWFVTNVLSGLVFSLVPTAVATLISLPILASTMVVDGWQIGVLLFLAANLQYICFFGMAVFAGMCVGNRFTMVAGYGLLHAGAYIVYFLVDTIYTPLLYGMVTPHRLAIDLTPATHVVNFEYIELQARSELINLFGKDMEGAVAHFTVTEHWWRLAVLAGVGAVLLAAALWLYKKRDLECAGDAVAFKALVPVFQVLCAIFVMTAVQFFLFGFLGIRKQNYVILALGLVVGWFVGKMLLERSTRVFRLRNWYGLGALAAVLALSLVCTHLDVLGLEDRIPEADRVESVVVSCSNGGTLEDPEDIREVLQLHQLALENRAGNYGNYVLGSDGQWVPYLDTYSAVIDEEDTDQTFRYVVDLDLTYRLKNGNTVSREYQVWVDSPAGAALEKILNRWEFVKGYDLKIGEETVDRLETVLADFRGIQLPRADGNPAPAGLETRQVAESFLEAVKADCAEGNMAQHSFFHTGEFRIYDEEYEKGYIESSGFWVYLEGAKYNWDVLVCPDSEHTVRWLTEHGLMEGMEVLPDRTGYR